METGQGRSVITVSASQAYLLFILLATRLSAIVIARSASDEAIQIGTPAWIASGARNDEPFSQCAFPSRP
jgi:hypothetical protein